MHDEMESIGFWLLHIVTVVTFFHRLINALHRYQRRTFVVTPVELHAYCSNDISVYST